MWNGALKNTVKPNAALIVVVLALGLARAQVNTEAMRRSDGSSGWYAALAADMGYVAGNSNLLKLKTNARADNYSTIGHTFVVGQFQQGRKDEQIFINKGFLHLRGVRHLRADLAMEGFVQQEFNEFINLRSRSLVGGGMRWGLVRVQDSSRTTRVVNLGVGAMWEQEEQTGEAEGIIRLLRSTNYLVLRWTLDDRLTLFSTTYFQVDIGNFEDYRILWEGGLGVSPSRRLALNIKVDLRYDNAPPPDVEKPYDLELTNGISYNF
ncbi:MAG: DUF481 domain-containing protein [Candidatus Neomarinimicrobiota bacterium]